jgi:hypothetical protein
VEEAAVVEELLAKGQPVFDGGPVERALGIDEVSAGVELREVWTLVADTVGAEGDHRLAHGLLPALGVGGVKGAVDARGHAADADEAGGGEGAVGGEVARLGVFLGHGVEGREVQAGELVGDAAVRGLHLEEPVEVELELIEVIGQRSTGFRNGERQVAKIGAELLPGPEHHCGGESGVDAVFAVVAGVVPTARAVAAFTGAGGIPVIKIAVFEVAGAMFKDDAVVFEPHRRTAALAVEAEHQQAQGFVHRMGGDVEGRRVPHPFDAYDIAAGVLEVGEVARAQDLLRGGICSRGGQEARDHWLHSFN